MGRTACSEACLAVYLHEKSFSVSRALAAHVTAPLSSGRAARSRRNSQLGYFLFGSVARLPGKSQNGHKQLGMERTITSSLVPFQPFQPGRNKLRHALSACTANTATRLVHDSAAFHFVSTFPTAVRMVTGARCSCQNT